MIDPGTRAPDVVKPPRYDIEEKKKVIERCLKDPFFFFNLIVKRTPKRT
ncbi:hypothetical protein [Ralstonia phage RSL2]|uniref:Uncharacterized protein n=1 Tax=Ralstonia phage RSL2 TaxID=1585840 RepID=A0A146I5J5_9CAUD|nr:hypothetical protein [Ralstonia phage RSL2]